MKSQLIVPAAGRGERLGCDQPKALIDLAGKPLLVRTLERFVPAGLATSSVIVIPGGLQGTFEGVLKEAFPGVSFRFVEGGPRRQDSVGNGLDALAPDTEIAVIHDAARPFVEPSAIQACVAAAGVYGAATVATPCVDTILVAGADQCLQATPDRAMLWACQTPQAFRVEVIRDAYDMARRDGFLATDDATLVRRHWDTVKLVAGSVMNFKVTTAEDLALAVRIVQEGYV